MLHVYVDHELTVTIIMREPKDLIVLVLVEIGQLTADVRIVIHVFERYRLLDFNRFIARKLISLRIVRPKS